MRHANANPLNDSELTDDLDLEPQSLSLARRQAEALEELVTIVRAIAGSNRPSSQRSEA